MCPMEDLKPMEWLHANSFLTHLQQPLKLLTVNKYSDVQKLPRQGYSGLAVMEVEEKHEHLRDLSTHPTLTSLIVRISNTEAFEAWCNTSFTKLQHAKITIWNKSVDLAGLCKPLKSCANLDTLCMDVSKCVTERSDAELELPTGIKYLSMLCNINIHQLCSYILKTKLLWLHLRTINLAPNIETLADTLSDGKCVVQTLRLHKCGLSAAHVAQLCQKLENHTHLKVLDLSNNKIGDAIFAPLCRLLIHNKDIKELYVRKNNITDLGDLCQVLHTGSLHVLDMSDNPVSSETNINHLCKMLRKNTSLLTLLLSKCGIDDSGVRALGEALTRNTTLTMLGISQNKILNPDTLVQLIKNTKLEAIAYNHHAKYGDNPEELCFNASGLQAVADAVCASPTLQVFDFGDPSASMQAYIDRLHERYPPRGPLQALYVRCEFHKTSYVMSRGFAINDKLGKPNLVRVNGYPAWDTGRIFRRLSEDKRYWMFQMKMAL